MTIEDAKKDLESLYQVMKSVMRNGIDYDTIKGTGKPTLLKPGAERLMRFFGLSQKVDLVEKIVDWDKPLFYYHYKVTIFKKYPDFEIEVAECDGSCNSFEDKYRWRWVSGSKLSNYGISDVTGLAKR